MKRTIFLLSAVPLLWLAGCSSKNDAIAELNKNGVAISAEGLMYSASQGDKRSLELSDSGRFDLSTLPGFDADRAVWPEGVTVENGEIKGASHATSIGAMAPPLRWVNDVRAQVLTYLDKMLK